MKVESLKIIDNLGEHTLTADCFVVKCTKCKKERDLLESDIDKKNNTISPKKCECGGENKFNYWLDSIYTEEDYKELERISKLKGQAIELFKQYPNEDERGYYFSLLQRKLHIGTIKTNKLLESLENDGVISKRDVNGKRKLL